jgi:TRAP-type uncharacterized transport system fused permease subunit
MIFFLVIGDSAFLAAAKTIVLIVLIKISDLLLSIRTPYTGVVQKHILGLSLLVGVIVYFMGDQIGGPLIWFIDDFIGVSLGDALYWTIISFMILKTLEILIAGNRAEMPKNISVNSPIGASGAVSALTAVFKEIIQNIWVSLEAGAKNMLVVGSIAGVLGILLSSATQSDLPGRVSVLLVELSFGLLPLTIFWVIIAGYIIGMGLPIVASYVILAIFAVGALTEFGVPSMAAHMISYWVAVVSAVTPPVALAAYAASAISNADPVKTGFEALRLASMIFVMPFLFVYSPILLSGTVTEITMTTIACVLGVIAWAGCLEGYMIKKTLPVEKITLGVSAACLLLPVSELLAFLFNLKGNFDLHVYLAGGLILLGTVAWQKARETG